MRERVDRPVVVVVTLLVGGRLAMHFPLDGVGCCDFLLRQVGSEGEGKWLWDEPPVVL